MAHAYDILGYAHNAAIYCEDCIGPDDSECKCGATDCHPRCAPIFADADFGGDPQYCDDCRRVVVPGQIRACLIDAALGTYVPRHFAQRYAYAWGITARNADDAAAEALASLLAGPDDEYYWDSWDYVLEVAESTDAWGNVWRLEQDGGDLYAVCNVDR